MNRLETIINGEVEEPFKIVFYADPGFGKSTTGSLMQAPLFLRTEEGRINSMRLPIRQNFDDLILDIKSLIEEEHDRKTLVIDAWDGIERHCGDTIAKKEDVESVQDVGWNKGPAKVAEKMRRILKGLDVLHTKKKMNILILSHVHITKIRSATTDSYDKFSPSLYRESGELLEEWSDAILYGHYDTKVIVGKDKKGKALSEGNRIIHAVGSPSYMAKNRFNLAKEYEANSPQEVMAIFNTIMNKE